MDDTKETPRCYQQPAINLTFQTEPDRRWFVEAMLAAIRRRVDGEDALAGDEGVLAVAAWRLG